MEKHKESVGIGLHVPIMRLFFLLPLFALAHLIPLPPFDILFFCAPLRRRRQRRLSRFAPSRHTAIQEKARFLFPNCLSCLSACLSCPFFSIHFTAFIYLYFFFYILGAHTEVEHKKSLSIYLFSLVGTTCWCFLSVPPPPQCKRKKKETRLNK